MNSNINNTALIRLGTVIETLQRANGCYHTWCFFQFLMSLTVTMKILAFIKPIDVKLQKSLMTLLKPTIWFRRQRRSWNNCEKRMMLSSKDGTHKLWRSVQSLEQNQVLLERRQDNNKCTPWHSWGILPAQSVHSIPWPYHTRNVLKVIYINHQPLGCLLNHKYLEK